MKSLSGFSNAFHPKNAAFSQKDDMPILCNRHTTSKLESLDDFSTLGTYGFRGEALASISYVARVTVLTMTPDSVCAYK